MTTIRLPPTTPEQRSSIYQDVRSMLVPGFISTNLRIQGTSLSLRTLSPQDFFLLRHRAEGAHEYMIWAVTMSIWMIDGQLVGHDQRAAHLMFRRIESWSAHTLNQVYQVLNHLTRRWFETRDILEAYFYERESRDLWIVEGVSMLESPYGITKGMNEIQRAWVAFNRMEDDWEAWKQQWSLAKFVVNPHAPKGIQRINEKDRERDRQLEAKRSAIRDRVFYETMGVIPKLDAKARQEAIKPIKKSETFEELEEEMKNWVLDIRDDHDKIIEGIKDRIREQVMERRRLEQERLEELERAFHEESKRPVDDLKGVLRPVTAEEQAGWSQKHPRGAAVLFNDPVHNHAFDKYLARRASPGTLYEKDGRLSSSVDLTERDMHTILQPQDPEEVDPSQLLQNEIDKRRPK